MKVVQTAFLKLALGSALAGFALALVPTPSLACNSKGACTNINCPTSSQGRYQPLDSVRVDTFSDPEDLDEKNPAEPSMRSRFHSPRRSPRITSPRASYLGENFIHAETIQFNLIKKAFSSCFRGLQQLYHTYFGRPTYLPPPVAGIVFEYLADDISELRTIEKSYSQYVFDELGYHQVAKQIFNQMSRVIQISPTWNTENALLHPALFFAPYLESGWFGIIPNLNTVTLLFQKGSYTPNLHNLSEYFPNLERIEFFGLDRNSPDYPKKAADWMDFQLWAITEIDYPVEPSIHLLEKIIPKEPLLLLKLQHLAIREMNLGDAILRLILSALPSLKELDLSENQLFTGVHGFQPSESQIFTLTHQKNTLESLTLQGTHLVSIDSIAFLSRLQSLDISNLDRNPTRFPDHTPLAMDLSRLRELTELKSLKIDGHLLTETPNRLSFIADLPHLETLSLQSIDLIDSDLDDLERLTQLREINVSGNLKITQERLKSLQERLPSLIVLNTIHH